MWQLLDLTIIERVLLHEMLLHDINDIMRSNTKKYTLKVNMSCAMKQLHNATFLVCHMPYVEIWG